MSNSYDPLFTSTLNTKIMRPYQAIKGVITTPPRGSKGNMTFIGIINSIYSGQLFNSSFITGNGTLTDSIIFTTKANGLEISTTGTIDWKFNITDDLKGFESGYIKVMGSVDSSTYHFDFTIDDAIGGDKFNCQFEILINVSQPCISQKYRIVQISLYDTNKISSKFVLNGGTYSLLSPFINFLGEGVDITILPFTCTSSTMFDSKPTLLSFTPSKTIIDIRDQLPIVYLTTINTEVSKCHSTLISYNPNSSVYNCSTELPLNFGYPGEIAFSIYGIVNNGGYFYGYSHQDIQMVKSLFLNTTVSDNRPVIISSDGYYSDDNGEIIIYGKGFSNVNLVSITETSSEESQKMIFKSLISLVSLRELDFNNKEVNNHIFDQWIYTPINQFKNQYFTTISNINITATLEWFNQSSSIQFANQNLTMSPSSIKYTIEITKYQFVMAALLTLNSNDICSSNQFGTIK
ncbi:hypothetical protein ACTA71_000273 [Dictyostelium dimigraforme]